MADVFVFGSNLHGIHGRGAALTARKLHGAIYGQGVGRQGNSYAIPTKRTPYQTLPLAEIAKYVYDFILYAKEHPEDRFLVTHVGCGLAGYTPEQIAPMFIGVPDNVKLPKEFLYL